MNDRRRGLGRGLQAPLIPTAAALAPRPVDVFRAHADGRRAKAIAPQRFSRKTPRP